MLLKAVALFLVVMFVLGLFGKLRAPRIPGAEKLKRLGGTRRCRACGAPIPGKGPCPCQPRS